MTYPVFAWKFATQFMVKAATGRSEIRPTMQPPALGCDRAARAQRAFTFYFDTSIILLYATAALEIAYRLIDFCLTLCSACGRLVPGFHYRET